MVLGSASEFWNLDPAVWPRLPLIAGRVPTDDLKQAQLHSKTAHAVYDTMCHIQCRPTQWIFHYSVSEHRVLERGGADVIGGTCVMMQ